MLVYCTYSRLKSSVFYASDIILSEQFLKLFVFRSSMWRYGFQNPPDYDDNQVGHLDNLHTSTSTRFSKHKLDLSFRKNVLYIACLKVKLYCAVVYFIQENKIFVTLSLALANRAYLVKHDYTLHMENFCILYCNPYNLYLKICDFYQQHILSTVH
jgi:hypothetical protein